MKIVGSVAQQLGSLTNYRNLLLLVAWLRPDPGQHVTIMGTDLRRDQGWLIMGAILDL